MSKKNISAIETGSGYFQGLVTNLMDVVRELKVPFEALYRLATPSGLSTLHKMVAIAHEDWKAEQPPTENMDIETISIPENATAEQLVADAKAAFEQAGIPFTYFDDDAISIIHRDLEIVKGKKLAVLNHSFGRYWITREGRKFQRDQGFDGNAAAYLVWVTRTKKMGWSVSIANTDDRLFPSGDVLRAPCFYRGGPHYGFDLRGVRSRWKGGVLVAFRAI